MSGDVHTRPTLSMLTAIQNTTLNDDVYEEDDTTNDLESYMARMTGLEAGLFVVSGTMGNQLALRSHLTQPPYSVLCDYRAHIIKAEAGGVSSLTGATLTAVVPSNGNYLTLADIQANIVLSENVHKCPTRVISLENTIGGQIMPLEECQRISAFAKEHGVLLHLDGARLWEAVAAGAGSLPDYAKCFNSMNMCFSKGLGAPIGSILVGSKSLIKHARWTRKSIGGGLRQSGLATAAARIAVDETFGKGPNGHADGGALKKAQIRAGRIALTWENLGGQLKRPTETNMIWLDLEHVGYSPAEFVSISEQAGIRVEGPRIVVHYQTSDEAERKLEGVMKIMVKRKNTVNGAKTPST